MCETIRSMTLSACIDDASPYKKLISYMNKNNGCWTHSSKGVVPVPPRADLTFKLSLASSHASNLFYAVFDCVRCTLRLGGDCDEVFSHPGCNSRGLFKSLYLFTGSNDTYLKLASCVCAKPIDCTCVRSYVQSHAKTWCLRPFNTCFNSVSDNDTIDLILLVRVSEINELKSLEKGYY